MCVGGGGGGLLKCQKYVTRGLSAFKPKWVPSENNVSQEKKKKKKGGGGGSNLIFLQILHLI